MSQKYNIIYTDKNDPSIQIRESTNFKGKGKKVSDPDSPATKAQVKYLINIGYKGKVPNSCGLADYLIKKILGTLKDHPDIQAKYEKLI